MYCNTLKIITIVDIPLMRIKIQVSLDILGCVYVRLFYLIIINVWHNIIYTQLKRKAHNSKQTILYTPRQKFSIIAFQNGSKNVW